MKKLILLLLVLFVSLPQISFGGKGKKEVSSVKIFLPKIELVNQDLKSGETVSFCSWNDLIDRIEITDNTYSWFKVVITKFDGSSDEVVMKSDEFMTTDNRKNKRILKIYPWIFNEGEYTIKVTKESSGDNTMRKMGEEPENEPEEVINFVYSITGCG
jgi:hypothetical protein